MPSCNLVVKVVRVARFRSQRLALTLCVCLAAVTWMGPVAHGAPKPVTLRLWHIPPKGSTYPGYIARRRVFEAFCKKYPEIQVQALVPLKIEGPAAEGNEFLAVAGGVAPDIFYLYGRKIGDYYDQGFLLPLDDYLARHTEASGKPYAGINAPARVWELCQIDKRIYCVPTHYYSMALICRRDIFARAGVPMRSPSDWDEFYRIARRMTWLPDKEPGSKSGDTPTFGLEMATGIGAGLHMLQYVWSSGGEVVQAYYPKEDGERVPVPAPPVDYRQWNIAVSNSDRYYRQLQQVRDDLQRQGVDPDYSMADLKWRLVMDTDEGAQVLDFFRRLIHTRWIRCERRHEDREFDVTAEMLAGGKAACPACGKAVDISSPQGRRRMYRGVVLLSQDVQQNLRAETAMRLAMLEEVPEVNDMTNVSPLAFPGREQGIAPAAFIAGHYLALNATQTDPRVRDAAWKYITFVTGAEAQQIRVATYVEHGLEEFIRPALLQALGYEIELSQIPAQRRGLWEQLSRYARVEPYCRGFQHVMTRELGIVMDAIVADEPDANNQFSRDSRELLAGTCRRVNTMILGELPEEVIRRRSRVGWFVAAAVVALLAAGVYLTIRLAVKMRRKAADWEGFGIQGRTFRRTLTIVLFLAPAVGLIVLWGYYPLARGTSMAFEEYRILGGSKFVGLKNFVEATSSPEFWRYALQTLEYLILTLAMGFVAPIVLAILLTEIPKGKILYRTIYYLPAVTTGIVTLFMWKQLLYDPTAGGLINRVIMHFNDLPAGVMIGLKGVVFLILAFGVIGLTRMAMGRGVTGWGRAVPLALAALGLGYLVVRAAGIVSEGGPAQWVGWFAEPWHFGPQGFLKDRNLAMFWIVVPSVWAGMGPGCLIYLAALKGIPEAQYEAADLDGAGMWAKCTHVIFPNLSALIIINFVGAVVAAMQASQNVFVMTGGGPEDVTMTVGLSIWFNAYMFLNFGMATAQAWILGAMLIGFTLSQLRLLNRMQFRTVATSEAAK